MKQSLLIGVDISKKTLDLYFKPQELHLKISNNNVGFKEFQQVLDNHLTEDLRVLVVMEHTGHYSLQWELYLQSKNISFCKVSALHIKRSLGLARGKTDKIDSRRIAQFGWRHLEELKADPKTDLSIIRLRDLISLRAKLVKDNTGYQCRLKELRHTHLPSPDDPIFVMQQQLISCLVTQIKQVDKMIKDLISNDPELNKTASILKSIKSIGPVISTNMIAATHNFTRFTDARKFNCYVGIAPFDHQSGTSIKGKARVSHMANKGIKALLFLAASNAIQYNEEMKSYYLKRIKEGKQPMAALNIIKAKLVARMFAVVKRGTPYQPLPIAA